MEEINKKLDDLGYAIEESQKAFEAGIKDTSKNAAKAVTDIAQELQDEKSKVKANEEQINLLAKKMARLGGSQEEARKDKENSYKEAFSKYLRKGELLTDEMHGEIISDCIVKNFIGLDDNEKMAMTKSLVAGNNPDGGYFVRPDFSNQVVTRVFETSPLRQYANVITTNSDVVEMLIDDNQATNGGWVGEVSDRSDTGTPDVGRLRIAVHEQFAQPLISQKLIDDAGFDIESWLNFKVTDRFSRDENTSFVVGDGSQKPRGFLTYPDYTTEQKNDAFGAYGRKAIEQVSSGVNGEITADGIKNLQNSLKEIYQPNAIWSIRRKNFEQIITLKDNQDRYIFNTRFLQESRTLSLLGKDVVFMNDMPDAATDSLSLAYADFSRGYTIVDRLGIRVLRDPYTAKPYVKYYAVKRIGGDVSNYEAIKLLKLSA